MVDLIRQPKEQNGETGFWKMVSSLFKASYSSVFWLDDKLLPALKLWLKGFIDWLRGFRLLVTAEK